MIPKWKDALKNMLDLVKPGGNLALIDFVTREGRESNWDQKLYKWWFAMDGVYFNREHVDWLRAQKSLSTIWYSEEESRVPYTRTTPRTTSTSARKRPSKGKDPHSLTT